MTSISIQINDKTFKTAEGRQHKAIQNLHISLPEHQFICLVGPSGCGKTTLLNIISGLDSQYQGNINFGSSSSTHSIGYVFQNPRLLPWRTVRENIELVTHTSKDAKPLIDQLLDSMQLTKHQHVYPEHLSLGMSRRVSIIRAFAINPSLLLMDEPFVSLDAPTARQVRQLLLKLWQKRPHTVLFVTHNLREAISLADKLIFLSSSPMSVVSEIEIDIPRHQRDDEQQIDAFKRKMIAQSPQIATLL